MKYEMHTTAQMETWQGIAWNADLILDGEKVAMVENRGDGGCDTVRFDNVAARKAWMAYVNERFEGNEETATYQLFIDEVNKVHYGV